MRVKLELVRLTWGALHLVIVAQTRIGGWLAVYFSFFHQQVPSRSRTIRSTSLTSIEPGTGQQSTTNPTANQVWSLATVIGVSTVLYRVS